MTAYIITFTGGLGAQLYSAAAYYYLEKNGHSVINYNIYILSLN